MFAAAASCPPGSGRWRAVRGKSQARRGVGFTNASCTPIVHGRLVDYFAAGWGSSRTMTVSAIRMISSTGRSAFSPCSRIASGLDAW